ncbi:hypothetical protein HDF14_005295 [Edaphobacter lichenicola]|uniref:Uncharacterized protein n=1 Tax=Tunturiibacter gelidiferens TaxID=3069689 RepID=A0A9X0QJP4_9BACT|nr:hypothetical protein [Edaphobacter lichenicola]
MRRMPAGENLAVNECSNGANDSSSQRCGSRETSQLLTNLERGGYRLAYNDVPAAHERATKYLGNRLIYRPVDFLNRHRKEIHPIQSGGQTTCLAKRK